MLFALFFAALGGGLVTSYAEHKLGKNLYEVVRALLGRKDPK